MEYVIWLNPMAVPTRRYWTWWRRLKTRYETTDGEVNLLAGSVIAAQVISMDKTDLMPL